MTKHGTALTVGQFAEFSGAVIRALPRDMDTTTALNWANNGEALANALRQALVSPSTVPVQQRTQIPALLKSIDAVDVPAVQEFVARDKFTTKKTPDGVRLYWMNENFQRNFLGKVERDVSACTLRTSQLTKRSLDKPILEELGDRAKTTLAYFWELLKKQPKGEKGDLLTNGDANIFYIEDENGTLWAVYADWDSGDGWYVNAYSVSSPHGWDADDLVFSR